MMQHKTFHRFLRPFVKLVVYTPNIALSQHWLKWCSKHLNKEDQPQTIPNPLKTIKGKKNNNNNHPGVAAYITSGRYNEEFSKVVVELKAYFNKCDNTLIVLGGSKKQS